jgi:HKD family nuclease
LIGQIDKELASADRADWLVSFIKFSGIRALKASLQRFTEQESLDGGPRLRIATTSYLGATDLKAIQLLLDLPNTEVRVSFDTHRTRLHAKAYLFHRNTGFGTAYVGSANVSRVALDEGLEWTARISQHELIHVWRQIITGFETHWSNESEFELIGEADLPRLEEALVSESSSKPGNERRRWHFVDLWPHSFQEEILDAIAEEREAGLNKHLVTKKFSTRPWALFDMCLGTSPSVTCWSAGAPLHRHDTFFAPYRAGMPANSLNYRLITLTMSFLMKPITRLPLPMTESLLTSGPRSLLG